MMKHYVLSEADREQLLRYLGSRPYAEVFQVIAFLLQLPEAPSQETPPEAGEG